MYPLVISHVSYGMRLILLQIGISIATLHHALGLPHGLDTNWIGQFDWFNGDWFTLAHWIGIGIGIGLTHWFTLVHWHIEPIGLVHIGIGTLNHVP